MGEPQRIQRKRTTRDPAKCYPAKKDFTDGGRSTLTTGQST